MNKTNVVLVLFGPSGCGKSTFRKLLVKGGYKNIKSVTTRDKRFENDEEYYFISKQKWYELYNNNKIINANRYQENFYGTLVDLIKNDKNGPFVMISDFSSLKTLKKELQSIGKYPIIIYCSPPDIDTLTKRHQKRGTEYRIKVAQEEILNIRSSSDIMENVDFVFSGIAGVSEFLNNKNSDKLK